ncbi:MAG: exo-alpha-sialidase [Bacteroidota bacterium]|nr:exo-alpha-sialidase [Bacteroidota bacterium]
MGKKQSVLFLLVLFSFTNSSAIAQRLLYPKVPGIVVDHSPALSGLYIGSPSICILPNGDYIASHDFFGPKSSEHTLGITWIFCSSDKGITWKKISEIKGQFWSTIFVHNNYLYIIGTSCNYGNLIIRRSLDGGISWTNPDTNQHGLLRIGNYHTAPTPVITYKGRIWRAMEHAINLPGASSKTLSAFMISADANADLLKASSWSQSNELPFDSTYLNGSFGGWLEGNAVIDSKGNICDILRVATEITGKEFASIIHVSKNGRESTFDPKSGFINFPGGSKKFTIRYDPESKLYWTLSNYISAGFRNMKNTSAIRNTLALCSSKDLIYWKVNRIVLQNSDYTKHGFQYVDWQFDDNDLIILSRTAFDDGSEEAHSFHDANFLTFHRIKKFRKFAKISIK